MQKIYLISFAFMKSNNFDIYFFYFLISQKFNHFVIKFSIDFVEKQISNIARLVC